VLVVIDDSNDKVRRITNHFTHVLLNSVHVPDDYCLVLWSRRHHTSIHWLRQPPYPFGMLLQSELQKPCIRVPKSDCVITGAGHDMITLRLHKFYARYLVVMPLQRFVTFEFLLFVYFPQLNSHIPGTWCHTLSVRIKRYVVNHTRMLSQCLFDIACLVVPKFDWSIFTRGSNLIINGMEYTSGNPSPMPHHLQFLRLSWNCISSTLDKVVLI
jgi:hypothetical protein